MPIMPRMPYRKNFRGRGGNHMYALPPAAFNFAPLNQPEIAEEGL